MSDDEKENFVYEEIPQDEGGVNFGNSNKKDKNKEQSRFNVKNSNNDKEKKLSFYESIKMGPIEKYLKHGIFPWKFIICILLVIFTICQVVLIVGNITTYNRAQVRGLYNLFIDDSDKLDPDYNREVYLFSLDELRGHMRYSINNFFNVRNLTLDDVGYLEGDPSPVIEFRYLDDKVKKMDKDFDLFGVVGKGNIAQGVKNSKFNEEWHGHRRGHPRSEHISHREGGSNSSSSANSNQTEVESNLTAVRAFYYPVNTTTLGPFDSPDEIVRDFINDVVEFKINYTLVTRFPYIYDGNFDCNQWLIVQTYSFASRAHFICKLDIIDQICGESPNVNGNIVRENINSKVNNIREIISKTPQDSNLNSTNNLLNEQSSLYFGNTPNADQSWLEIFVDRLLWIHCLVLIFSTASLILTMRSMYTFVKMFVDSKKRMKKKKEAEGHRKGGHHTEDHLHINENEDSLSSEDSIYFNPLFDTSSSSEEEKNKEEESEMNATYEERYLNMENISNKHSRFSNNKKSLNKNKNNNMNLNLNARSPSPNNRKESLFAHQAHEAENLNNDEITNKKKNRKLAPKKHFLFLQFWSTFIIIGNFLQILGASMALNNYTEITTIVGVLIGSGCLFACISTGKYIEYQSDYATIYETLKRSFPVIIRYLIGVFPIFLGFLFFGVCVFWKSERFNSTSRASMNLFAMIQGDAIFSTFTDLSSVTFFLGQIYCYLFCIIFIIIVWNIFISIIEEAYVVTKVKNKTSWIYNYLDLEPKLVDMRLHSKPTLQMTKKYFEKMDKSSEILKRRISRSLRSTDILNKASGESFEGETLARSVKNVNKNLQGGQSYNNKDSSKDVRGRRNMSTKGVKSYFAESIPEHDEFDYRLRGENRDRGTSANQMPRRKYTFEGSTDDKEKLIDGYFTKIENRVENIKKYSEDLFRLMLKRRNYVNYSDRVEVREELNNKVNNLEFKAKELRQIWMRNY